MERLKFQDLLRRSFIRYSSIIVAAIVLLVAGGFLLNFFAVVVGGSGESNRRLSQRLETQYRAYAQGLEELAGRPELLRALDGDRFQANQLLYQFVNGQQDRAYFLLLGREGQGVCSNFNGHNQELFATSSFAGGMVSRLRLDPEKTLYFACTAVLTQEQNCVYTLCRAVSGADGATAGYLFFNLREESFRELVRGMAQEVLITDRYDNVIYTTLDLQADPMDKLPSGKYSLPVEDRGIIKLDGDYQYVTAGTATPQAFRVYTITSLNAQVQAIWYSLTLFMLLFLVLAVIIALLSRAFTRQNAREIGELTRAVEELDRGSADYLLPQRCSQESQELYAQFRRLTLRLRQVIRHNKALQDCQRRLEVKQLEEQFNPHFVFNVMETVRYQIGEDPEAASEMLLSFANLMRYSINYGCTKVRLETDVEYINDYLLLQKVRYNNCLRYEFRIPEELLDCQVPKLLFQPIIENSIRHGYQAGQVLNIVMEARREGDDLRFTVRDDGCGISPDRLRAIEESFDLDLSTGVVTHIGLYNVQKVLRLLYGPAYGLHMESEPGKGTTITLNMPMETEEELC